MDRTTPFRRMMLDEETIVSEIRRRECRVAERDRANDVDRACIDRLRTTLELFDEMPVLQSSDPAVDEGVAQSGDRGGTRTDPRRVSVPKSGIDMALAVLREKPGETASMADLIDAVRESFGASLARRSLSSQLTKRARSGEVENVGGRWRTAV